MGVGNISANIKKEEKKEKRELTQAQEQQRKSEQLSNGQMNSQRNTHSILEEIQEIPAQCRELDAQLQEGAAGESGKLGRSATEERQLEERTNLLQKRDRLKQEHESFFAPGMTYIGKLTEALRTEKEQNAATVRAHLTASVEQLTPDELLAGQQTRTPQMDAMFELFTRLQGMDAGAVTKDQIQALKVSYDGLQLEQPPVAMAYLDGEHPDLAYLALFHSVSMALFEQVNRLPKEAVNLEMLGRLYGIVTASSVAVGTAQVLQQQERQKEREQQAEAIKKEAQTREAQNIEAHLAANKRYIREGIGTDGKKPEAWPMADYAEAAIRVLGEEQLKTLSLKEVALRTERMQEQLQSNINLIGQQTAKAEYAYPLPMLQNLFRDKVRELIGDHLLTENYSADTMKPYIDQARELLGEARTVFDEYLTYLREDEVFSQIPGLSQHEKLQAHMTGCSLEEFKEKTKALRTQLQVNLEMVERRIADTLTGPLCAPAKRAFLTRYGAVLLAGSVREIGTKTDWFLTYICEYAPELFDEAQGMNATEYLLRAKPLSETEPQRYLYSEQLKGQELCKWNGFGDAFLGYEDALLQCVEKALADQVFGEEYLSEVHSVSDLDNLQYNDFQAFLTMLRAHLAETVADWAMVKCPMEREIRIALLPGMLSGAVKEENFLDALQEQLEAYDAREQVKKQRKYILLADTGTQKGEIAYRYLDVTANTSIHAEPRHAPRTRRFEHAAQVRVIMHDLGLEDALEQELMKLLVQGKLTGKQVLKTVEDLIKGLSKDQKSLYKEQLKELNDLCDADDGCGLELVLSGFEDLVMKKPQLRYAFAAEKSEKYQELLLQEARELLLRKKRLNEVCQDVQLKENIRQALVGIENPIAGQTEQTERNLARFGVESFEGLMRELEIYRQDRSLKEKASASKERYEKRLGQIGRMRGGLYRPLLGYMTADQNIFEKLTVQPDAAFEQFLDVLDKRLLEPVKLLARSYGVESGFAGQVFLEYGAQMVRGEVPAEGWKEAFYQYYAKISEHTVGKTSINATFREILEKQKDIAPYLISILLEQREGSMLLADPAQLDMRLEIYRANIRANEDYLKKECAGEYAQLAKYLLKPITTENEEEFRTRLPERLAAYRAQEEQTREDTAQAIARLDVKKMALLQVEIKKQKGREKDAADRAILQRMKQGRELLTPVIMAYQTDEKAVPSVYDVAEVKQRVQKALGEQAGQLPQIATELLVERVIASDVNMDQAAMQAEAARLAEMYEKVTSEEFEKQHVQMSASTQEAFLTYLYCREKTIQGADTNTEIEEGYAAFAKAQEIVAGVRTLPVQGRIAAAEKEELLKAVQTALYTMPVEQLREFAERRSHYVLQLSKLEPVCAQAAGETYERPAQRQALELGLIAYFREELAGEEEINPEALREQIKTLLRDEDARLYLSQTKAQLLGETGSDAMTAEEQQTDTFMTRERFEEALDGLLSIGAKGEYNRLSLQERKVFALALSVPGMHAAVSGLRGHRLFSEGEDEAGALAYIQAQVQHYIHHEEFAPQIDYAKAYAQLQSGGSGYNYGAYNQAMEFVQLVEQSRQAQYEPDYERLRDAKAAIEAARRVAPADSPARKQRASEPVSSPEQFFTRLESLDEGKEEKLKQRLHALSGNSAAVWRLIQILQDRTVIDYSTTVGFFDRADGVVTPFVNEGKRLAMLERAQAGDDLTAEPPSAVRLEQAMNTLLGYQLRNDLDLSDRKLTSEDFAKDALKRKTVVDWELLKRALDFVDEMNRAQTRLNAMKQAPKLILQGKNEKAKEEYRKHTGSGNEIHTQEQFDAFLEEQAKKEGQMAVLAGYRMLRPEDRTLFVRALGSRWVLDVSKEHIMANRFGMMDRDYADPAGRDELCNEYFENAVSSHPGVSLSETAYEEAFAGMLSAQVNDAADYTQLQNADLSSMLSTGAQWFGPSRTTAVDWKLVMRALQLVHRCVNESEVFVGDRELYVSQGDLSRTGQFEFHAGFMRQNLHSAGNRLTRYFGRRVAENAMDQLPGPLLSIIRGAIPVNMNNALSQYAAFAPEEEEEEGLVAGVAEKADTLDSLMNDTIGENAKKYGIFSEGFQESFEEWGEKLGGFSSAVGYLSDTLDIIDAFSNKLKLSKAGDRAKEADAEDEVRMREAAEHQTTEQAQRSRQAKERNVLLQGQAKTKASERQTDAIIDSVASIVGSALGDAFEDQADIIETAVTEAGKFINMVRSYRNDKASVREYFEKRGEIARLKEVMEKELPGSFKEEDSLELLRQARGYENYTEMASFVGLNVTRSLLFCASAFNRQESLRIVALATLGVLGMEDVIGSCDDQSAQRVYDAIMGGEYR